MDGSREDPTNQSFNSFRLMEIISEMRFGAGEEPGDGRLLEGWADPEDGFTWTLGLHSTFTIEFVGAARDSVCTMLELTLNPFMLPGDPVGQELTVLVNDIDVGGDKIHGEGTVSYVLPQEAIRPDNEWTVTLIHPEAKRPAELGFNDDNRMLGFSLRKAAVVRSDPLPSVAARPHPLPAVPLPDTQDASVLKPALREVTGLVAEDLAGSFESLGHNCEFGMMQRHCGIEPFGLFRFAGVTLEDLLGGLDQAFEGLGTLDQVEAFSSDGIRREFLIRDRHYNISIHTLRFEDETTAEIVRREQSGQLRFFKRNFIEILESGEKLFVFQRPGQTLQSQMRPLLTRLRHYGPNGLLFVTDDPSHPPGTVEQLEFGLFRGYMDRFAPQEDVGQCNLRAWLSLCANAKRLWSAQQAEAL